MTLSPDFDSELGTCESGHPYAYARVLGVFHADVVYVVPGRPAQSHSMEFLWVRWFRLDRRWKGGFKQRRLHRLEPLPETDPEAYGFLDPDDVIRAVHLIPAFAHGRTSSIPAERTGLSVTAEILDDPADDDAWYDCDDDWRYYYVNLCVPLHPNISHLLIIVVEVSWIAIW